MTTLAADKPRIYGQGVMNDLPVIASDIIYEGAFVGENASGYSRPLVAGDPFQGVCARKIDNSAGAAGAVNVRVYASGILCNIAVAGATAITANDHPAVYASDDDTLTLTAGSNTLIGNVLRWISSGICDVTFSTPRPPSTVGTADIENEAVTVGKMADLAQGSLYSGQASNRPAALDAKTDAQILVGDGTDINSVAMSGDVAIDNTGATTIQATSVETSMIALDAIDNTLIADNAVSLENLDAALTPSHIVKYAGEVTWTGGGTSIATTVTGVAATDIVMCTIETVPSEAAYIVSCTCSTNTVTTTLSAANTSNDAVIAYVVYRAAA
jgi:hypothetical protein